MFAACRKVFSRQELVDLGTRMRESKEEQMREPMPEREQIEL
jgi:hypothetical protein